MPTLLVLVPFKDHHLRQIEQALGEGWQITTIPLADCSTPTAIGQCRSAASEDELVEALCQASAVIGEPDPVLLRRAADAGAQLKLVQMTWSGTDKYTRSTTAFPKGVALCNVAGAFGQIISQYVVGQTLSLMQNLPAYQRQQQRAEWNDLGPVASLDGANVLIFGAGNIGTMVAKRLQGFSCTITGVCRNTDTPRSGFGQLVTLEGAEKALASADVVVGAIPNNSQTAGWLDERRLALMKESSVIVNVGRGNFIDCDALAKHLASGRLRGAALDVSDPEPLPPSHPLWAEPRCTITPHVSGGSFGRHAQTENNICAICCKNLAALAAGEPLFNQTPESAFAVPPA